MAWETPQIISIGLLLVLLVLFVWGRLRYDFSAMAILLVAVLLGVVPQEQAFTGFAHPAVITVALVLILSLAIQRSGVVDALATPLAGLVKNRTLFLLALCGLAALLSGFMNNVGALALLMPLAMSLSDKPALVLMPLSFATILGGMTTLIGTPPNIIVSSVRADIVGAPFAMFDFTLVGGALMLIGVAYVALLGWRFLPQDRTAKRDTDVYSKHDFLTELEVPQDSKLIGTAIADLEQSYDLGVFIVGLIRNQTRMYFNIRSARLQAGDILIARASPEELQAFLEGTDLDVHGADEFEEEHLTDKDVGLVEAVVGTSSVLIGRTPKVMRFRRKHSINLLALSRRGASIHKRLPHVSLQAGDVLLVQGAKDGMRDTLVGLGCLPIASKALSLERQVLNLWPVALFGAAVGATALGLMPIHIAFALALGGMIIAKHIQPDQVYSAVDWPIIVLLAAMIPLGDALLTTGATGQISALLVAVTQGLPAWAVLAVIMLATMTLSDLMNNAATAVVMAPLSVQVARTLEVSPDPFLMCVALGASCAFMTPIGHQNNLLVMGPGGYAFGDYWRMGLLLQLAILLFGIPLVLWAWPL